MNKEELAKLGARYLRACGVTGEDEVTSAVAERMLNLAALGERVLEILRGRDKPNDRLEEDAMDVLLETIQASRELGLLPTGQEPSGGPW